MWFAKSQRRSFWAGLKNAYIVVEASLLHLLDPCYTLPAMIQSVLEILLPVADRSASHQSFSNIVFEKLPENSLRISAAQSGAIAQVVVPIGEGVIWTRKSPICQIPAAKLAKVLARLDSLRSVTIKSSGLLLTYEGGTAAISDDAAQDVPRPSMRVLDGMSVTVSRKRFQEALAALFGHIGSDADPQPLRQLYFRVGNGSVSLESAGMGHVAMATFLCDGPVEFGLGVPTEAAQLVSALLRRADADTITLTPSADGRRLVFAAGTVRLDLTRTEAQWPDMSQLVERSKSLVFCAKVAAHSVREVFKRAAPHTDDSLGGGTRLGMCEGGFLTIRTVGEGVVVLDTLPTILEGVSHKPPFQVSLPASLVRHVSRWAQDSEEATVVFGLNESGKAPSLLVVETHTRTGVGVKFFSSVRVEDAPPQESGVSV